VPAPVSSLIPTVEALRQARPGDDRDVPVAVWEVLTTLDDPRARRGRRHELASVLTVALAAVLGGARTLAGIAGWAADQPCWALRRVGVRRRAPSLSTIRRVLLIVDPDVMDAVLHAWLAALAAPPQVPAAFRAVAVDGKTCRGALGPNGARVHLFSIVEHATGIPLGQVRAPSKGFEIAAFATVLDRLDLSNVVVTADALHTQRAHARYLHRHHSRYVFIVKGNQPSLHAQLRALPWAQVPVLDRHDGKGHGRARPAPCKRLPSAPGSGSPTPAWPSGCCAPEAMPEPGKPPKRACTRSPAWAGTTSPPPSLRTSSAVTGASRTPSTTSVTPPSTKTPLRSAPAPPRRRWPPSATSPSA